MDLLPGHMLAAVVTSLPTLLVQGVASLKGVTLGGWAAVLRRLDGRLGEQLGFEGVAGSQLAAVIRARAVLRPEPGHDWREAALKAAGRAMHGMHLSE